MKGMRIPIAGLMAIIVVVAVELAALGNATGVSVDVSRILTVALLVMSTYLARYRTGAEGAWWFGFSLFGWSYYVLMLDAMGRWFAFSSDSIVSFLPAAILDYCSRGVRNQIWTFARSYAQRLRIVHEIFILVVAISGGIVCWVIERRRRPERPEEPGQG